MENKEQQKEETTANKPAEKKVEIDNDKMWATVAYFIFFLPLLFVKNRSAFLNYHINQGIILLITYIIGDVVFDNILKYSSGLEKIWILLMLVLLIIGISNVNKKEMKPLPIIGKLYNFIK